jgi:Xaa-Pro aminopeptidase
MTVSLSGMTPQQSYAGRLSKAKKVLAERGLDALVLSGKRSMYWATGFNVVIYSRPQFVLITPEKVTLIVPRVREKRAQSVSFADVVIGYSDASLVPHERDPYLLLQALIAETPDNARVGYEAEFMTISAFRRLEEKLGGRQLEDASSLIRDLRMVKDPWEIDNIRKATHLAELGMATSYDVVMNGGTEIDSNVAVEKRMLDEWSRLYPNDDITGYGDEEDGVISALWCWTRAGKHIAMSLPASTHEPIADDEPCLTIIWATINGYGAEFERTFSRKPLTGEAADAWVAMMTARDEVLPMLKPGAVCEDLVAAAREVMLRYGFETGPGFLGHGLGLGHHERPQMVPGTKTVLEPGMALAFEPAIFKPTYGVTQSDMVLITETGNEVMTDWKSFIPA